MSDLHRDQIFQKELTANSTEPLSPALINEALKIHDSHSVAAAESQFVQTNPRLDRDVMLLGDTLDRVATSDYAKAHPKFAASIYRDLAVVNQGLAIEDLNLPAQNGLKQSALASISLVGTGPADKGSASDCIDQISKLEPNNRDLPALEIIQLDLMKGVGALKVHEANEHHAPVRLDRV